MEQLTGIGLAMHGIGKKGTPYVYGAKGAHGVLTESRLNFLAESFPNIFTPSYMTKARKNIGKVCTDCSGLISWYTGRELSSSQMYSQASARLPIADWDKFAVGVVLWKNGHVGIYIGNGLVAEATNIDQGTIISKITDQKWVCGLVFSYIDYNTDKINYNLISAACNSLKNGINILRR